MQAQLIQARRRDLAVLQAVRQVRSMNVNMPLKKSCCMMWYVSLSTAALRAWRLCLMTLMYSFTVHNPVRWYFQ